MRNLKVRSEGGSEDGKEKEGSEGGSEDGKEKEGSEGEK